MTIEEIHIPITVTTDQEAFDAVVRHLAQMKVQSTNGEGACMYRGPEGSRCAIGALILDEKYNPRIEYASVGNLIDGWCGGGDVFDATFEMFLDCGQVDPDLLTDLQRVHDNAGNWVDDIGQPLGRFNGWKYIRAFGERYGLDLSVLDTVAS